MISVEDKIDIFEQELNSQIEKLRQTSLAQVQKNTKLEEEKADLEIKKQNQIIKDRFHRQENRNVSRVLAEGRSKAQEIILNTKKKIRTDFYETITGRIREIIQTQAYHNYFRKNLREVSQILDGNSLITFFVNNDELEEFKDDINNVLSDFTIRFEPLPERKFGGFIIHDQDDRVRYDYSLENLINENQESIDTTLNQIINGDVN